MVHRRTKTENVKVRVEPLTKLTLEKIAEQEKLEVSDIARRAFEEFINRRQSPQKALAA